MGNKNVNSCINKCLSFLKLCFSIQKNYLCYTKQAFIHTMKFDADKTHPLVS